MNDDEVMGPMEPRQIQDHYIRQAKLVVWVIYERPLDRPNDYVVRPHVEGVPLKKIAVCGTLPVAQSYIPTGLTRILRDVSDDPRIVEVWV